MPAAPVKNVHFSSRARFRSSDSLAFIYLDNARCMQAGLLYRCLYLVAYRTRRTLVCESNRIDAVVASGDFYERKMMRTGDVAFYALLGIMFLTNNATIFPTNKYVLFFICVCMSERENIEVRI